MKKIVILSAVLLAAGVGSANAQSLLELLGGKSTQPQQSGQTQTETPAVQKITFGELKGVWKYAGAAVEFTGTDLVAMLGSSVAAPHIKQSLETIYSRMGVVPGSCTLEFKEKEIFAGRTAVHTVEGTYRFDAGAQTLGVSYDDSQLGGRKTLDGKLTYSDRRLVLAFEAAAIVAIIKEQTKDMSLEQNVKDLIDLISQYPGLYLGFVLEK